VLLHGLGLEWRLADQVWAVCSPLTCLPPAVDGTAAASMQAQDAAGVAASAVAAQLSPGCLGAGRLSTPLVFPPPTSGIAAHVLPHAAPVSHPFQAEGQLNPMFMCSAAATQTSRASPQAPSLLSPPLLAALQAAFDPCTSPFWPDHAYNNPDTPFFSYIHDLRQSPRYCFFALTFTSSCSL